MTTKSTEKVVHSKASPLDVLAKARLDSGVHVAMSPNMVIVPEVSVTRGERFQARMDGMYAWAEFAKWPSFHIRGLDHLSCIPMRPEWKESRKFMGWRSEIMLKYRSELEHVLWKDLREEDYSSKDPLDLEMGTLSPQIIKELQETRLHVMRLTKLISSKISDGKQEPNIDDPNT
ncbi:hypothetical protein BD410DRAFT_206487 [Rickenella mellea]|uniref:Uncharacterized protein n=1 Tax=Rickenella mellea TaxID=50990 RepID=A0A4Y7Q6Q8_9AGAM|nr:hypothetical protein BD410DRAFT_206487 [Rickenella mellea]